MAAMRFVVNTVPFLELGASNPGGCPLPGRYYSSDTASGFGPPPLVSSLEYDRREITYPNVDGISVKDFGQRGLIITASLVYIGATKANCMGMIIADFMNTNAGNFTQLARYDIITPDGTTWTGCNLIRGGANITTWGPPMNGQSVAQIKAAWKLLTAIPTSGGS